MRLYRPDPRTIHVLLIVGFCSIGYALYLRYMAIEQSSVGLACQAGLNTWLCATRQIVTSLFNHAAFGWAAVILAALQLIRPSSVLFAAALAAGCFGVVLYNVALSALALSLLVLSFARRAPEAA